MSCSLVTDRGPPPPRPQAYYEQELAKQSAAVKRQRKGETGEEDDFAASISEVSVTFCSIQPHPVLCVNPGPSVRPLVRSVCVFMGVIRPD